MDGGTLLSASGERILRGYAPRFRPLPPAMSTPGRIPTLLLGPLKGMRKVARVQVALHGVTIVLSQERQLRHPYLARKADPEPRSVYVHRRYQFECGPLYGLGIAPQDAPHHPIEVASTDFH